MLKLHSSLHRQYQQLLSDETYHPLLRGMSCVALSNLLLEREDVIAVLLYLFLNQTTLQIFVQYT